MPGTDRLQHADDPYLSNLSIATVAAHLPKTWRRAAAAGTLNSALTAACFATAGRWWVRQQMPTLRATACCCGAASGGTAGDCMPLSASSLLLVF